MKSLLLNIKHIARIFRFRKFVEICNKKYPFHTTKVLSHNDIIKHSD